MRTDTLPVRIPGQTLHVFYWRGGNGQPLVLLQGGMANAEVHWKPVWAALARDFDVIAPDLPGFGRTPGLQRPDWRSLSAWLKAFLDELGVGPVALVGNSFGGTLARALAGFYPEVVRALVLVDGGGFIHLPFFAKIILGSPLGAVYMKSQQRAGISRDALSRMIPNPAVLNENLAARLLAGSGAIYPILRGCVLGPQPPCKPSAPMLIVWGENDRHVPAARASTLQAELPGSHLVMIKNAGHLPQLEQPEEFVKVVCDFVMIKRPTETTARS